MHTTLYVMNNDSIEDLSLQLQELSLQRTYAEEALDNITRELAELEHRLRVA